MLYDSKEMDLFYWSSLVLAMMATGLNIYWYSFPLFKNLVK